LDSSNAGPFRLLYSFTGGIFLENHSRDGGEPIGGLVPDGRDGFYGTTNIGGGPECNATHGCGTIFHITSSGKEKVIFAFGGQPGAAFPNSSLIKLKDGRYLGTTSRGGPGNNGTVFELSDSGRVSVLYAFKGQSDGSIPSRLTSDRAGNIYGATAYGGGNGCDGEGCGTVFKIAPDGSEKVVFAFPGGLGGANPWGGVVADQQGNLYGTTFAGGDPRSGCGTVFKLSPNGTERTLVIFNEQNGCESYSQLTIDKHGNLFGTTVGGGTIGAGVVFMLPTSDCSALGPCHETILHSFAGGTDGAFPLNGVLLDKAGNLFGTTSAGGLDACWPARRGCGTIFEVAADGTETILQAFGSENANLTDPQDVLIMDRKRRLYGTATSGGSDGVGGVFAIDTTPSKHSDH